MSHVIKISICIGNQGDEDEDFAAYVRDRYPDTDVVLEHCGHMRFELDGGLTPEQVDAESDALLQLWDAFCSQ